MIQAAALCPGPPLLVPELSGPDPDAARLRAAARVAAEALVVAGPDLVAVVGSAEHTATWPASARADLAVYGRPPSPLQRAPLSVGLGAWLLESVGYDGPVQLRSVAVDAGPSTCDDIAAELAAAGVRVGLLVIADGTAKRTLKAPGYLDHRAEPYDAAVHRAVADGDLPALRTLDPDLARELMSSGWPALQVLAAAFGVTPVRTDVHYHDAPFGVGYLVASLRPA